MIALFGNTDITGHPDINNLRPVDYRRQNDVSEGHAG